MLAYKSDKMHLDMNLFMADNELLGNGASPIELLDIEGREAVYTHPDQTNNELTHVNITGDFVLTDTLSLTANMFIATHKLNQSTAMTVILVPAVR